MSDAECPTVISLDESDHSDSEFKAEVKPILNGESAVHDNDSGKTEYLGEKKDDHHFDLITLDSTSESESNVSNCESDEGPSRPPKTAKKEIPVSSEKQSAPNASHSVENGGDQRVINPAEQVRYEKLLEKTLRRIEKLDNQDVDWDSDDENNSAYLLKDRLIKKFMKTYAAFCKTFGCSPVLTDRPVQKKFKVERITRFPEIDMAVETFLNHFCKPKRITKKKGPDETVAYAMPEYNDIFDVVQDEIGSQGLTVECSEVEDMARILFRHTVEMYKVRRVADLHIALPHLIFTGEPDPADTDLELNQKLEENLKKRRTEDDVLREFSKKQEASSTENEVLQKDEKDDEDEEDDEDDDDEDDDDDDEEEEDDTEEEDKQED